MDLSTDREYRTRQYRWVCEGLVTSAAGQQLRIESLEPTENALQN